MLFDDIATEISWLARSNKTLGLVTDPLSPAKSIFRCIRADDITTRDSSLQRETGVDEALTHWRVSIFDVPETMVLPLSMACSNERPTSGKHCLTGELIFVNAMYERQFVERYHVALTSSCLL